MSKAEATLMLHIQADPMLCRFEWIREHRFAAEIAGGPGKGLRKRLDEAGLRDWRFDFACPQLMLAIEVEGGAWTGGRHTRGQGFAADLDKHDAAMRHGWTLYRCDPRMVRNGQALDTVRVLVEQMTNSADQHMCGDRWLETGKP